jgi:hypothetical protein
MKDELEWVIELMRIKIINTRLIWDTSNDDFLKCRKLRKGEQKLTVTKRENK